MKSLKILEACPVDFLNRGEMNVGWACAEKSGRKCRNQRRVPAGKRRRSRVSCRHTARAPRFAAHATPRARSVRVACRSRVRLWEIFVRQKAALVFGCVPWTGHPCQKHPSTKMASLCVGKTKCGRPGSMEPRRQPLIPCAQKIAMSRSSVACCPASGWPPSRWNFFAGRKCRARLCGWRAERVPHLTPSPPVARNLPGSRPSRATGGNPPCCG